MPGENHPSSVSTEFTASPIYDEPSIIVDESASDDIRSTLTFYDILLRSDPAESLRGLQEFTANPFLVPSDAPWHQLTDRSHPVFRAYEFDDGTEEAIRTHPRTQRIRDQRGPDQGVLLRAWRLEVYLERLVQYRVLGNIAIAQNRTTDIPVQTKGRAA